MFVAFSDFSNASAYLLVPSNDVKGLQSMSKEPRITMLHKIQNFKRKSFKTKKTSHENFTPVQKHLFIFKGVTGTIGGYLLFMQNTLRVDNI